MKKELNDAYFSQFDSDTLLRRCAAEIEGTDDPQLQLIYAAASAQFCRVKAQIEPPKETKKNDLKK